MKKLIIHLLLVVGLWIGFSFIMEANSAPLKKAADNTVVSSNDLHSAKANVQGAVQVEFEPSSSNTIISKGVIKDNWGILSLGLLSFLEIVVRLTPSEQDNSILNFVSKILNAIIPNLRKGGGVH